jgi:CubicO group peptidase (beta-lactamase class C family)
MSLVIAKEGMVVFAEGYGQIDGVEVTTRTPQVLYSCMKPILGIQLAMYVDRGFVKLDQPVGDFLPEFGGKSDLPMTFHASHVHATGIEFPWELAFSRLFYFRTWQEALIAQCPREWPPATRMRYGIVGVILAVRSLELLSGENYWDALEKELLAPMEVTSAYPGGTGFSAEDLARIGILLANRGKYGYWEFYSENTHERILPQTLTCHFPHFTESKVRGIGLVKDERMGPNGYGHGGGGLLAIDPDTHVVVSLRQYPSEKDEFLKQLFQLIQELRNRIATVQGMH